MCEKEVRFISHEGIKMYEGDNYWFICDNSTLSCRQLLSNHTLLNGRITMRFASYDIAVLWLEQHKPKLELPMIGQYLLRYQKSIHSYVHIGTKGLYISTLKDLKSAGIYNIRVEADCGDRLLITREHIDQILAYAEEQQ